MIKTKRLILRPVSIQDAQPIFCLLKNPKVLEYLQMSHLRNINEEKKFLKRAVEGWKKEKEFHFAITLKNSEKIIGVCGLSPVEWNHGRAHIGYWVGEPFWGQGYASEAVQAATRFAFKKLRLRRLYSCVYEGNEASRRVLEKIGFRYEGCQKAHFKKGKKIFDVHLYGLLAKNVS